MAEYNEEEYLPLYNNEYYDPDEFLAEEQVLHSISFSKKLL